VAKPFGFTDPLRAALSTVIEEAPTVVTLGVGVEVALSPPPPQPGERRRMNRKRAKRQGWRRLQAIKYLPFYSKLVITSFISAGKTQYITDNFK
jgi:hypothetical protein